MFLGAMKQLLFYCHFKVKYKNVNEGGNLGHVKEQRMFIHGCLFILFSE